MSHNWQSTSPLTGEMTRRLCVFCDVIKVTRMLGVTEYSHDGKAWSQTVPECVAPAAAQVTTEARS